MAVPFENRNFHKELEKMVEKLKTEGKVPTLLLHSCCAPCSSSCIEFLSKYFHVSTDYILKLSDVRMTQEYRLEMEQMLLRHFEFFLSYCRLNRTNQKVISFLAAQMEKAEEKKIKE